MKIILLKDVPGTGRRNDVKEVNAGFAQNFLIPKKLGVPATQALLEKVNKEKTQSDAEAKMEQDLLLRNLESLEGKKIAIKSKVNEEGHLFAGIHKEEVLEALKKDLRLNILPECLLLDKPIKEAGEHTLSASAHGKTVSFTLEVEKA